ncbi:MAG: acyl-CoA dehydrogenase family protein, partial [Myxococcales bacterium]|nr:acyl-CoA dehydrogenase family protein [Myxococcales bacterium]
MDFSTSESTTRLLERARAFVHEHVIPSEPEVLEAGFLAAEPRLAQLRDQVKAAGMWGPQLPRELGGLGLTLVDHGLISEVLGQSPLGHYVFGCQAPDAGNIEILHRYGTT